MMRAVRIIAYAAVTLVGAYDAMAVRFAFRVVNDAGVVVDGAEVCIFPAAGETPLSQWFGSNDLRCFPATTILAFPPGRWNVLARLEGRAASHHPFVIPVRDDPANTDTGYRRLEISLGPAAVVSLPHPATATTAEVFYFPGTAASVPFAIPTAPGQQDVTLPAGLAFVPFATEQGRIVGVGKPRPPLQPGAREALDPKPGPAVLSYLRAARIPEALSGAPLWELPAPRLRLTAASGPPHDLSSNLTPRDGELLIFSGVTAPAGEATLDLVGPVWEDSETPFTILDGAAVTLAPPLSLAPAAALEVRSSLETEQWLAARTATSCRKPSRWPQLSVDVARCDPDTCSIQRSSPIDALLAHGMVEFDRLPVGRYSVRILSDERVLARADVLARSGWQPIQVETTLSHVRGRVTRGGAPVEARLIIGDGTAVTDADGTYSLFFRTGSPPDRIELRDCASAAEFVIFPSSPIGTLTTQDIELPAPAEIAVLDAITAEPVAQAEVRMTVPDSTIPGVLLLNEPVPPTGADGHTRATTTPLGAFAVCASATDYEPACVEAGTPRPITLRLAPSPSHAGSITGVALQQPALLFFVTAQGVVTEMVRVATDGTFRYQQPQQPDSHVVFVSATQPLIALRLPLVSPLVIALPPIRSRSVSIRTGGQQSFELGVILGGLRIPAGALSRHQAFRGLPAFTTNGQLVLADLADTGPIEILRGFPVDGRPPMLSPQADPFAMPEYLAKFPRQIARGAEVVFPE